MALGIFAALAEYEWALISEHTKKGIEAAWALGISPGRRNKISRAQLLGITEMMKEGQWSGCMSHDRLLYTGRNSRINCQFQPLAAIPDQVSVLQSECPDTKRSVLTDCTCGEL